jgi:predicted transposase/invertase (TIGR01784 family)
VRNIGKHDKGYKRILSRKQNFLHFIKKYIQADWVDNINENDLIPIDKSFIDAEFKNKESDVIYKIKLKNKEIIFYVLLELQSSVDYTMPFRLLKYMTELMKREFDNIPQNKREAIDYRLPAVVPIILYNGSDNWTAVKSFKEYLQKYEQFGEYIIDFKYFLFDLNRMTEETILSTNKLLDIIFALDKKKSRANAERILNIAAEYTKLMSDDDRDDILNWLRYIWLSHIKEENIKDQILNKFEKGDITDMMYGIDMWVEEERQTSKREGKREGIKETNLAIARKLYLKGFTIKEISETVDLSEEEIKKEIKSMKN